MVGRNDRVIFDALEELAQVMTKANQIHQIGGAIDEFVGWTDFIRTIRLHLKGDMISVVLRYGCKKLRESSESLHVRMCKN